MSNDINGLNLDNGPEFDFDPSESIWKIDGPIGRKDFIWAQVAVLAIALPAILLNLIGLATFLFPVIIILILIALWLSFAAFTKRFYDLMGSLKWSVILTILLFLLNVVLPIIGLVMLFVGIFIPGKLIRPKN